MMGKLFLLLSFPLGILFAQTTTGPKNIIVMIGDGMGVSQVAAGRTAKGTLALDRFKTVGLLLTHGAGKDYVTDSAASATALSTGVKTYNGAIGVRPDTVAVENIFERARKHGKKTGIVAVCSVTHATPASFVAHVPLRSMELEIAKQIAEGPTDIILGSGWGWFLPKSQGGRRTDDQNLISLMKKRGYTFVSQESEFRALGADESKRLLGLFAENHVGLAQDRKPSLKEMTALALESLASSNNGFILMVEGSQIDWAGHYNNSNQIMLEMSDFDDAIGVARDFAEKDQQTLVIVTADHETGGYSLIGGSLEEGRVEGRFTAGDHTAAMVPLFAYGPGSQDFGGIHQNSDVGVLLLKILQ